MNLEKAIEKYGQSRGDEIHIPKTVGLVIDAQVGDVIDCQGTNMQVVFLETGVSKKDAPVITQATLRRTPYLTEAQRLRQALLSFAGRAAKSTDATMRDAAERLRAELKSQK